MVPRRFGPTMTILSVYKDPLEFWGTSDTTYFSIVTKGEHGTLSGVSSQTGLRITLTVLTITEDRNIWNILVPGRYTAVSSVSPGRSRVIIFEFSKDSTGAWIKFIAHPTETEVQAEDVIYRMSDLGLIKVVGGFEIVVPEPITASPALSIFDCLLSEEDL